MKKPASIVLTLSLVVLATFFVLKDLYQDRQKNVENTSPSDSSRLVRDWSPSLGPTMARVVVVEFLDPECEACRAMHPMVKGILDRYKNQLRYVVRYMPFHGNSRLAAQWLEAARKQNKYWEALDALFSRQNEWGSHHNPQPGLIPEILSTVGVDIEEAKKSIGDPEITHQIEQDMKDGVALGVKGTPTFFVNGKRLEQLGEQALIDMIEAQKN